MAGGTSGGNPPKPPSASGSELRINKSTISSNNAGGQAGNEGPAVRQRDPTDSMQDVKSDAILKGFISRIKPDLEAIDKKLKEIRKKANGAVRVEMPLSGNLVVGKGKKPLSPQDFKPYEMVLTWGDDSDNVINKRRKLELQEIPPPSGTEWKISVKPPVAGGPS